eukprot:TRINITY_DN9400_c0_g1_i1.p1 TRINITY_DN9400_c0_g1~~TRINITY_DN9400_c0_g1_i1.p1  ORF type:complete len:892 (+),score=149.86 TRINITY_DN9400_c0_g1_i1:38-2713(+)
MGQCASGGKPKREDSADRAATRSASLSRKEPQALPEEKPEPSHHSSGGELVKSEGEGSVKSPSVKNEIIEKGEDEVLEFAPDPAKNPLLVSMTDRFPASQSPSRLDKSGCGIRFYCPTAICGGVGIRENTLTHCTKITKAAQPGLRVDSTAPYWCPTPFTIGPYCKLIGSNTSAERYYPSEGDQYMMILKGRKLTIMSDKTNKQIATVTLHTGTPPMEKQRAVLEASGVSIKSDKDLQRWKITELRNVKDTKTKIAIEPSTVRLCVKGDSRVTDWPLTSPLSSKVVVIEVSGVSLLQHVVVEACKRLIGRYFDGASLALSGKEISSLSDALATERTQPTLELILPPKTIIVGDTKVTIPAGFSTTQTLKHLSDKVTGFGKDGSTTLKNVIPSWKKLTDKSTYEIETDVPLLEVGLLLGGGSLHRVETVREMNLATEAFAVFGARANGSRMLITKAKWKPGEECLTYNEGTQKFETNIVVLKEVEFYVLEGKETGTKLEVEHDNMFIDFSSEALREIHKESTPRVRLHASHKNIVVQPPTKAGVQPEDLTICISTGFSYKKILNRLCDRFGITQYSNRAFFTCRRTGSVITPQNNDLWSAVTYDGMYSLNLREKPISIIVKSDVDVTVTVPIHYDTKEIDVLEEIQRTAGCKCCPGDNWKLTDLTTGAAQLLDYQPLVDNGVYVLSQDSKIIYIESEDANGVIREQDFAVSPQVKPGELWRVISAHPALALQETWSSYNLPVKNWSTPSVSPVAGNREGTLGLLALSTADGEPQIIGLESLAFAVLREKSCFRIQFPAKRFSVVGSDGEHSSLWANSNESAEEISSRIQRMAAHSDRWVVMDTDNATAVASSSALQRGGQLLSYSLIKSGHTYHMQHDVLQPPPQRPKKLNP